MTEAPHDVEADAPMVFRQHRHALLVLRPLASSKTVEAALDGTCDGIGAIGAARLAFADGVLSHDRVFAAILGGGPLSEVAPFVYLTREGGGLRVFARGPLCVVELPNAPRVGVRPAVVRAAEAITWVEVLLPDARGVEVLVEDARLGLDDVPIRLLFSEPDEAVAESLSRLGEVSETTADPDLDGAVGPGEAVHAGAVEAAEAELLAAPLAEATIIEVPSDDEVLLEGEALPEDGALPGDEAQADEASEQFLNRGAQTHPVPIVEADASAEQIGEHDGRTILSDEASRIRQDAAARRAAHEQRDDLIEPQPVAAPAATDFGEHDGLTVAGRSLHDLRRGQESHGAGAGTGTGTGTGSEWNAGAPQPAQAPAAPGFGQQSPYLSDPGDTVLAQALTFATRPEAGTPAPAASPAAPVVAPLAAPPAAPPTSASLPTPASPALAPPTAPSSFGAARTGQVEASYAVDLSTGGAVDLVGPIVLGRAPNMGSEQTGGVQPRHVKLSGATDISRNHVLLSVEGGVIVVTDLHSRNGTDVVMPGRGPQRLRAGEPTAVMPGTVIDLGSGIFLTVRSLSTTARP